MFFFAGKKEKCISISQILTSKTLLFSRFNLSDPFQGNVLEYFH